MVGSHLAEFLLERTDWDIVGMCVGAARSTISPASRGGINAGDRVSLLYGDLREHDVDPEVVATPSPTTSSISPPRASRAPLRRTARHHGHNVQGTVRVLDALKQHAPKAIIHVCASSEVFGRVPREKLPIDEECTFQPGIALCHLKVGTDLVGRFYAEAYGMTVMTTRMFTHTGPRRRRRLCRIDLRQADRDDRAQSYSPVVKVGNLQSLRTVADVRDAVRAYYMLVTVNPTAGAYYNIGGTHSCTVKDILDTLISFSAVQGRHPCRSGP